MKYLSLIALIFLVSCHTDRPKTADLEPIYDTFIGRSHDPDTGMRIVHPTVQVRVDPNNSFVYPHPGAFEDDGGRIATEKDVQRIEKEINDLKRIITDNNKKADDIYFDVEPFTPSPHNADARRRKDTSGMPALDSMGRFFGTYPWYDSALLESDTLFFNSNMYKPVNIGGRDIFGVKRPLTKEDSAAILELISNLLKPKP